MLIFISIFRPGKDKHYACNPQLIDCEYIAIALQYK